VKTSLACVCVRICDNDHPSRQQRLVSRREHGGAGRPQRRPRVRGGVTGLCVLYGVLTQSLLHSLTLCSLTTPPSSCKCVVMFVCITSITHIAHDRHLRCLSTRRCFRTRWPRSYRTTGASVCARMCRCKRTHTHATYACTHSDSINAKLSQYPLKLPLQVQPYFARPGITIVEVRVLRVRACERRSV
jgi:hypothetical protein